MRTALIVIDMQLGSFTPYSARHDTLGTIERINRLAAKVRAHGMPARRAIRITRTRPAGTFCRSWSRLRTI